MRSFAPEILALGALVSQCGAQSTPASPLQVFDIRSFVRAKTGRVDFVLRDVSHSNGRWVVLVDFEQTNHSMIVGGTLNGRDLRASGLIEGHANRIALDAAGKNYVRMRPAIAGQTEIEMRDSSFEPLGRMRLEGGLEQVFSGTEVLWLRTNGGSQFSSPLRLEAARPKQPEIGNDFFALRANERREATGAQPELRLVFGLHSAPKQRWVQFGNLSEEIAVVENDGTVLSRARAALDDAYRTAGLSVPARDSYSGRTLVGWATLSHKDELYVCLSSLPVKIPAQIAVIEPSTGRVLRVIAAQLPSSPERISEYNPAGNILPLKGVADDGLIVFDGGVGVLAIYSIQ